MPIYEYRCLRCANEFELIVLRASPVPACPACESPELEQLLSAFAVSSDGIRRANVQAAQRKSAASSDLKDKRVADAEYMSKEHEEHGP